MKPPWPAPKDTLAWPETTATSLTYELYRSLRTAAGKAHPSMPILDCPCGCPGCWTLKLEVRVESDSVTWSRFKQIHRNQPGKRWDYSNFSPFRFPRPHYVEQMKVLKQLARISRADLLARRAAWRESERLNLAGQQAPLT